MKQITADCFLTNADMLDKDVLRYCENFYQYVFHITNFFGESLTFHEIRWLEFLCHRIDAFLYGAPTTDKYVAIVSRYTRLYPKLKRILDEQFSKLPTA